MNGESSQEPDDPLLALRRVLHGVFRLDLADGAIRVRIGPLPDSLVAAGAVQDGRMWLFIDREKPGGIGHARELLEAHPELIEGCSGRDCPLYRGMLTAGSGEFAEFILKTDG